MVISLPYARAARGIFDAIYGKPSGHPTKKPPEFRWEATRIELLSMPTYLPLRRNEVGHVASTVNIGKWMKGVPPAPMFADDPSTRQQRQTMAIRNPHYRLYARIVPWPGFENQQVAFDEQFRRRASHGKCWMHPALGCREFVAFFRLIEDLEAACRERPPVALDQEHRLHGVRRFRPLAARSQRLGTVDQFIPRGDSGRRIEGSAVRQPQRP